jgi:hypothetical protein
MSIHTKEQAQEFLYRLQQDPLAVRVSNSCPRYYSTGKGSTQCCGTTLLADEEAGIGVCEECLCIVYLSGGVLVDYDVLGLKHPKAVPAWTPEQYHANANLGGV